MTQQKNWKSWIEQPIALQPSIKMQQAKTGFSEANTLIIEGKVNEIHVGRGRQNLLEKVHEHYRQNSAAASVGFMAGDLFGQAALSAVAAMYDGENTQNFVLTIDAKTICGQFAGAEMIKQGSYLKVAASRQGDVLIAHSIICASQGYIYIAHPWGLNAERVANFKLALWMWLLAVAGWFSAMLLFGARAGYAQTLLEGSVAAALICIGAAAWANSDMKQLASPSTVAFRLFGFANPESVNLKHYAVDLLAWRDHLRDKTASYFTQDMEIWQHGDVYCYQRAIDDGKLALA